MLIEGTPATWPRVSRIAALVLVGFLASLTVRALAGFKCSTRSYRVVNLDLVDASAPDGFLPAGTIGVWYNCSGTNGAADKCFEDWVWDLSLVVTAEPNSQFAYDFEWSVPNETN